MRLWKTVFGLSVAARHGTRAVHACTAPRLR